MEQTLKTVSGENLEKAVESADQLIKKLNKKSYKATEIIAKSKNDQPNQYTFIMILFEKQ